MSNDFEIAHWVARHKKVLDLAISIRNGMISNANEHDETTLTSSSRQQISIENVLSPPEIEQVIIYTIIYSEIYENLFIHILNLAY